MLSVSNYKNVKPKIVNSFGYMALHTNIYYITVLIIEK